MEIGAKAKQEGKASLCTPGQDDCFMLSYTSGTTGDPKGVKLTHRMILSTAYAVNNRMVQDPLTERDCYISYLPAAHSFE